MTRIQARNPFKTRILGDAWSDPPADVRDIHSDVFTICRDAIEYVINEHRSCGVLLEGVPGAGKTHILARLRKHFSSTPRNGQGIVALIYVRLHTSPGRIWQHIRECLVKDLLRMDGNRPFIGTLLSGHFARVRPAPNGQSDWWSWFLTRHKHQESLEKDLEELLGWTFQDADIDLLTVLLHLMLGRHSLECLAWLRGNGLSEIALRKLGVAETQDTDDREDASRRMVQQLCEIVGRGNCLALLLDQIEAMEVDSEGQGYRALGRMISTLHDSVNNTALITSVQRTHTTSLITAIRQSEQDRMTSFAKTALSFLSLEEAQQVVESRLNQVEELNDLRSEHGPLYPVRLETLKTVVDNHEATPRKVLAVASQDFELWQSGTAKVQPEEAFFDEELTRRRELAIEKVAPDACESLLAHALPTLMKLAQPEWTYENGQRPPLECVLNSGEGRVGIGLCNTDNMGELTRQLKAFVGQLDDDQKPLYEKLVLVRHPERIIKKTSVKGRQLWSELEKHSNVCLLRPAPEALAALQAIRELMAEAESGKLAHNGDPVTTRSLSAWLAQNLDPALADLVETICQPVSPVPPPIDDGTKTRKIDVLPPATLEDLAQELEHHKLLSLVEAANKLDCQPEQLTRSIQAHPERFRMIGGRDAVVYCYTGERSVATD